MNRLSLPARLLVAIVAAALLPLVLLAFILAAVEPSATGSTLLVAVLLTATIAVVAAVLVTPSVARGLLGPLGDLARTLGRLHAGDLDVRLPVESDDELGRLAESHNRLAATLAARNRSLALVSHAVAGFSPRDGVAALLPAAESAARDAFGFTGARVVLGPEDRLPPPPERVPGEAYEVRIPLAIGDDRVGTLVATQIPTREWGRADEDLLRIFGVQLAAAIRNAELFAAAADLAELKNEFLRGVSHNLQTPLTSIRAFAGQLADESNDRRLDIIVEQTDRLTRLVAQLLTVSRLEAGTLKPQVDVFAVGPLVRRAWESLGRTGHPFQLRDEATGWLAAADRDWVEQVVWALLDNAVRYGGEAEVEVTVQGRVDDGVGPRVVTIVRDHGPGIPTDQRERAFERFVRLAPAATEGSGLGLPVARGLIETMGGRLDLTDVSGPGAAFAFTLPAERIEAP